MTTDAVDPPATVNAVSQAPVLTYAVTPQTVNTTVNSVNPSVANLQITITNNTDDNVTVKYITFQVPYGENATTLVEQANLSAIQPSGPVSWSFKAGTPSGGLIPYLLEPNSPTVLAPGLGVVAYLNDVQIDTTPGAAIILVMETLGSGTNYGSLPPINKAVPGPVVTSFSAVQTDIAPGTAPVLNWTSSSATGCTLYIGSLNSVGTPVGATGTNYTPSQTIATTTTFYLEANGSGLSSSSAAVVVTVATPLMTSFNASPAVVSSGGTVDLSWTSSNAEECYLFTGGFNGQVPGTGTLVAANSTSYPVSPTTTTTYTIVAYDSVAQYPSAPRSLAVTVPQVTSLTVSPTTAPLPGSTVTLDWTATGQTATSLTINPYPDVARTFTVPANTTACTINPVAGATITLSALNGGAVGTSTATVANTGSWQMMSQLQGATNNLPTNLVAPGFVLPAPGGSEVMLIASNGSNYVCASSPDGYNWATQPVVGIAVSACASFFSFPGNATYYAFSPLNGMLWHSVDGVNWNPGPTLSTGLLTSQKTIALATCYNGTYFLYSFDANSNLVGFSSPDANTWTALPALSPASLGSSLLPSASYGGSGASMAGLTVFQNQLVLTGNNIICTSSDGVTWDIISESESWSVDVNGTTINCNILPAQPIGGALWIYGYGSTTLGNMTFYAENAFSCNSNWVWNSGNPSVGTNASPMTWRAAGLANGLYCVVSPGYSEVASCFSGAPGWQVGA